MDSSFQVDFLWGGRVFYFKTFWSFFSMRFFSSCLGRYALYDLSQQVDLLRVAVCIIVCLNLVVLILAMCRAYTVASSMATEQP